VVYCVVWCVCVCGVVCGVWVVYVCRVVWCGVWCVVCGVWCVGGVCVCGVYGVVWCMCGVCVACGVCVCVVCVCNVCVCVCQTGTQALQLTQSSRTKFPNNGVAANRCQTKRHFRPIWRKIGTENVHKN